MKSQELVSRISVSTFHYVFLVFVKAHVKTPEYEIVQIRLIE